MQLGSLAIAILFVWFSGAKQHAANPQESTPTKPANFQQADLCEMLKHSKDELQLSYPNEYYDCHAHSRFFKLS